ncbi:MAG: FHA domain-containing protein [Acidimicrobiaceae bacterium]|nr:FHA domain-containing protein [Acidimicrobiaceae bacterium]
MLAYFPVRLAGYGVILVIALVVVGVKKLQSAMVSVNPGTFVPELTVITREYTPVLPDPQTTIAQIATSIPGVTVVARPGDLFFEVRQAGGLFVRVRTTNGSSSTRVEVAGRRKVSGLESVNKAEDALMAFESALRRQLAGRGHKPGSAGGAPSIAQSPPASTPAASTPVAPQAGAGTRWPAPSQASQASPFTIAFDTGSTASVEGTAVIGRNPATRPTDERAVLLPIDDPTMSVSKTHVAIGRDGSGFWVQDRSSTNGSVVTEPDGNVLTVIPERTVRVQSGSRVQFGDRWLEVR